LARVRVRYGRIALLPASTSVAAVGASALLDRFAQVVHAAMAPIGVRAVVSALRSSHVLERMGALRHPYLAEVRARGLFFGAEFVAGEAPATALVAEVVERMVARGFLLNRIGRAGNILKLRPPMPFGIDHADLLMDALEAVLAEIPLDA